MTDESARKRKAHMAEMLIETPDLAPKGVIEVGYMIHDFLTASVADADTGVDTGAGMGAFDLWVRVGGHEYLVTVKHSGQCRDVTHLFDRAASGIETEGHDRAAGRGAEHESPTAAGGDAQNIAQDIGGPSQ